MTRLCLLAAGWAEGWAETLLLLGWPARAAPIPIPLAPASIQNRAEGLPPALSQAGAPHPTLPALPLPLGQAGTAPTPPAALCVCVCVPAAWGCAAWPRLPGGAGPGAEVWGALGAPHRHRGCRAGIQVMLLKGLEQTRWHWELVRGLVGGPSGSTKLLFPCLCARVRGGSSSSWCRGVAKGDERLLELLRVT